MMKRVLPVVVQYWDKLVGLLINSQQAKFSVEFQDWGEIRMGSPYNNYSVTFTGRWKPNLHKLNLPAKDGWTNLYASSEDKRYHALVVWNVADNTPGFQVIIFDTQDHAISVSERYRDFPHTLRWEQGAFKIDHDIILPEGE